MKSKNLNNLNVLIKSGALKGVYRTGWAVKGIKEPESVADHTWRMSLIVILLAPENLDLLRLLKMCIIHDLGEVEIGDIKWEAGQKTISSPKTKHGDELRALGHVFKGNKKAKEYVSLLKEYNLQLSPESKFLKQVDKLEMILQAYEYENLGYDPDLFNEFWENAEKYLSGTFLEQFSDTLKEKRIKSKKS